MVKRNIVSRHRPVANRYLVETALFDIDLILSRLMVQGDSLLGSKHIDGHVRANVVVGVEVALIPGVEFSIVLRGILKPEEELLLVGTEAALHHRVLIG